MPFPGLCGLLQPLTVLETTSGTSGPVAACYRAILALARSCGNLFGVFWNGKQTDVPRYVRRQAVTYV